MVDAGITVPELRPACRALTGLRMAEWCSV